MTNKHEIHALFDKWNNALLSGNPDMVTECYAEDATLLPTISNQVRHNREEIRDYFKEFLALHPKGEMNEENVRILVDEQIATNSGRVLFNIDGHKKTEARYSFVYQKINGDWFIIEHHSSVMPES